MSLSTLALGGKLTMEMVKESLLSEEARTKKNGEFSLKHSCLRSMNNVEETKVDFHKVISTGINLEAGEIAVKTLSVFTATGWAT